MWLQFITGEYKKSSILLNACFSFCNRSQAYFLLFLESRDKPKVLQTNLYCLLEVCVLTIFSRIVGAWYWKSVILSRAPRICQREDFWPIRAWYQSLVWNGGIKACLQAPLPFPPPQATARLASLTDIFPFWPCAFLPQCGAWSQARLLNTGSLKIFTGHGLISIIDIIYAILIFIYAYLCLFIIQKHFMQGKNRIINTLPSNQYIKQSSVPSCNLTAV